MLIRVCAGAALAAFLVCGTVLAESGDLSEKDRASFGLAQSLNNSRRYAEAIPVLKGLHERYPANAAVTFEYAKALGYGGTERESGIALLRQLYTGDPADTAITKAYASVLEMAGKPAEARGLYMDLLARDPANPDLVVKVAELSSWMRDYSTAADYYNKVVAMKPGDNTYRQELIVCLYSAGRLEDARQQLSGLSKGRAVDVGGILPAAMRLLGQEKLDEARQVVGDLLELDPGNRDLLLWNARILSWQKKYVESTDRYEMIIAKYPQWKVPYIEKARVLGWSRQYAESLRGYARAVRLFPDDAAVELEYRAKRSHFAGHEIQAARNLATLLEVDAENLEARFDLAQIYSVLKRWENARQEYARILDKAQDHFRAATALAKVEIVSVGPAIRGGAEMFAARSLTRDIDIDSADHFIEASYDTMDHVECAVAGGYATYRFEDRGGITRRRVGARVELEGIPYVGYTAAEAGASRYSELRSNEPWVRSTVTVVPVRPLSIAAGYRHDDVNLNSGTFEADLVADDYTLSASLSVERYLMMTGGFGLSDYSDGNRKRLWEASVEVPLLQAPYSLTVGAGHERYWFEASTPLYFSPQVFFSNELFVQWRQFFSKHEMFWGADFLFYTLKYRFLSDSNGERGHIFQADLSYDWNQHFNTAIQAMNTIYENKDVYEDRRIQVHAAYTF